MKSLLIEEHDQGIILATLNRPKKANALSIQLLRELNDFLTSMETASATRAIIFTSNQTNVFCAGADLKERSEMNEREVRFAVQKIGMTINRIASLKQPTIAAMNGSAFGGGLELALACDFRVGMEEASYGLTETSLAIIPGAGGTQRLARLVGIGKAKELIFTASRIDGLEAKQIGLIEHVEKQKDVVERAFQLARQIASNGPIAVRQAKFAIDSGIEVDLQTGLTIERNAYENVISTEDRKEGLLAFQEKRKPLYKGE
ncbi:methylglutaconyl-CoA hydratase [Halalkalibacter wakoensis JCM 9140]|uniref:Methylglutaconyl-CoA hydratase n=1 Tax=Halalkalibacter wakoensis JCM 9140 TaxID=1236970 RepID=W4Q3A6_9BACI|nr:enoyl-CoA hydratase [Halalkalibacter wakoensis]GAE25864.1 methylglutaconyl-CoA hydratase [Halalkalibacter wakoensis JCM 9140]